MPEHANPIQVQKYLKGTDYPVSKSDVPETARRNKLDQEILDTLEGIPEREYDSPNAVTREIGTLE